jgi:hypothetical protein
LKYSPKNSDFVRFDENYTKEDNRVTSFHQSNESVNIEMIEISTNIDKSEPSSKKAEPIIEKTIKVLQGEDNTLRLHMSEIKEQLSTHSSEYNRKSILNYAKYKLLTQQTKRH